MMTLKGVNFRLKLHSDYVCHCHPVSHYISYHISHAHHGGTRSNLAPSCTPRQLFGTPGTYYRRCHMVCAGAVHIQLLVTSARSCQNFSRFLWCRSRCLCTCECIARHVAHPIRKVAPGLQRVGGGCHQRDVSGQSAVQTGVDELSLLAASESTLVWLELLCIGYT